MARKRHHEEHTNHEAWAIPYADLVTLLLAFFVVMYSISSVNEGKYRVLAQSIAAAFKGTPKVIEPIQVGKQPIMMHQASVIEAAQAASPASSIVPRVALPNLPDRNQALPRPGPSGDAGRDAAAGAGAKAGRELEAIAGEIEASLAPLIERKLIVVRRSEQWLEVEIKTDILFPSAVATFSSQAQAILERLAEILGRFPNAVRVEGYTDDRPINTFVFPSNWELSAARAASVVRLFVARGVDPERLALIGWGEQRPADRNDTAEGRNRNRRVLIVVLSAEAVPRRFFNGRPDGVGDHEAGSVDPTGPIGEEES